MELLPAGPEAEALVAKGLCPRCKASLLDVRGKGFSAKALEREKTCFLWGEPDRPAFWCSWGDRLLP